LLKIEKRAIVLTVDARTSMFIIEQIKLLSTVKNMKILKRLEAKKRGALTFGQNLRCVPLIVIDSSYSFFKICQAYIKIEKRAIVLTVNARKSTLNYKVK